MRADCAVVLVTPIDLEPITWQEHLVGSQLDTLTRNQIFFLDISAR